MIKEPLDIQDDKLASIKMGEMHVYIDESGDTGGRSRYIVFAVIVTDADRALEKLVKKVWNAKPQYHSAGELHAVSTDNATRKRMVLSLADADITMYYSVIDKMKLTEPAEVAYYRELARVVRKFKHAKVIIADKKDTDRKREKMIEAVGGDYVLEKVFFERSHNVKQLQAVDFVAWSVGRRYEYDDESYLNLLTGITCI